MQVIGTAATGADTLELLATQQPDVLVLDIGLPDANGVELAARLHRAYSGLTILLLTGYTPRDVGSLVGHQGVRGYVHKTAPLKELVAAIRAVAEGRRAFVPGTALLDAGFSSNKLTERERKVWTLLVRGQHNAEIAAALQLSLRTTERCLQGLRAKVGVRSTRELRHNADARGIAGGP
jgi:DNA-binding NarL/FixJ family response regulator